MWTGAAGPVSSHRHRAFLVGWLIERKKGNTKPTAYSALTFTKKKKKKGREEVQDQYIQMGELHLITVVYIHWTKFTSFI